MIGNMLVQALFSNKKCFQETFCLPRKAGAPQFDVYMVITEGKLDSDPKFTDHRLMFASIFQAMEDAVFKN